LKNLKYKKLAVFIGLVVLMMILNHFFSWSKYFSVAYSLPYLKNMVNENITQAGLIYVVLTVVGCVVLAIPGVAFAIIAGLVFGPLLGTFLCSLATTIGAAASFLVGRYFLKESIKPKIEKNRYLKKLLFDETDKNAIITLMVTRLVPIFPFNLQNFAYGITDMSFWHFAIYSCIFMLPGTAMYTVGAAGLADKNNRVIYILVAIVLGILVFSLGHFLQKRNINKIR